MYKIDVREKLNEITLTVNFTSAGIVSIEIQVGRCDIDFNFLPVRMLRHSRLLEYIGSIHHFVA